MRERGERERERGEGERELTSSFSYPAPIFSTDTSPLAKDVFADFIRKGQLPQIDKHSLSLSTLLLRHSIGGETSDRQRKETSTCSKMGRGQNYSFHGHTLTMT